jgi:hypothetical protein
MKYNSMKRRLPRVALAASLALLSGVGVGLAATDPAETAPGHTLYSDPAVPDISGLYMGTFTVAPGVSPVQMRVEPNYQTQWAPWPPPLTPAYRKLADEKIAAAKKGRAIGDIGSRCLPFGQPVMMVAGTFPFEIIQTPGVVMIWVFGTFPVFVWTDGRPHPEDLKPSYNGDSIGYWVGDTLYVDTVGIMDTTPLENAVRTPHSGKLHMSTTFERVDDNTLHVHVTLRDPDALTEPMVTTNIWRRKSGPSWQVLDDASCFENNRNQPDETGAVGFKRF